MTILQALRDRHLFGTLPAFRDLGTWSAWRSFLAAVYGLPMSRSRASDFPGAHGALSAKAWRLQRSGGNRRQAERQDAPCGCDRDV
jgi:hypothetical protein